MTDRGDLCVICGGESDFQFLGVWLDDAGAEQLAKLTDAAGRRVRACTEHAPQVMHRLASYPQSPPRVRAVPYVRITLTP
jgi:hypothetical protein